MSRGGALTRLPVLYLIAVLICLVAPDSVRVEEEGAERPITARDRDHWSFRALERHPPPPAHAPRARDPIDCFILERLERAGLEPLPEADRRALIRRATFDLTGLPPEPDEVEAFVADPEPDAWERLLDRLLASPAHGERWAQHWLDLARFAETDGFEHDGLRPNAWRYRDWVIDALNCDLPHDEFVRLQIAGDLIRPDDPAAAIATGFTLCGPDMPDINSQDERRHMVLNEMTATVGSVFLGLRLGCAQCHEHKSDPISQADFYRFRAFFDGIEIFRDHVVATPEERRRRAELESGLDEEARKKLPSLPRGRVLAERRDGGPPKSFLMVRGDWRRPGSEVRPAFLRIADARGEALPAGEPPRLALARWVTRPDHPLATRVTVNRIWQHHFGHGLARTPGDFGSLGDEPVHSRLLDWLAGELPRLGWSVKRMHRAILSSAAYRRASGPVSPAAHARDPENRLLSRQSRKRLDAEAIRDSLLAVGGQLSSRRGGVGVMPPLPEEVRRSIRGDHWKVSPDREDHHRRSIYLFVRRNLRYPFFEVFDRPDTNASCARRNETTSAPQSLALLNSDLVVDAARHFAGRVLAAAGDDRAEWVRRAYVLALSREPTREERRLALETIAVMTSALETEGRSRDELALPIPFDAGNPSIAPHQGAALTSFCLSLCNLNEFIYVD